MSDHDPGLERERLVDELILRLEQGEPVDLEALAAAHPDHAADLRRAHADWQFVCAGLERGPLPGEPAPELPLELPMELVDALLDRLAARAVADSRYEIREELGRGGMGVVYKVWDRDLRRTLAMKSHPACGRGARFLGHGAYPGGPRGALHRGGPGHQPALAPGGGADSRPGPG